MSRGISRQQHHILYEVNAQAEGRWRVYKSNSREYRTTAGRRMWAEEGWPPPTYDPWVTPRYVLDLLGDPTAPVSPSRLRSVQRAMVSLAGRGLLVKDGPRYTTPAAARRHRSWLRRGQRRPHG